MTQIANTNMEISQIYKYKKLNKTEHDKDKCKYKYENVKI